MSERRPTPPLVALRAFDAAARHGSFREAAEELGVTPGAVSRHVKALEMRLGLRLFDRFNRSVRLTADGVRLAQGVADAFERLESALDAVRPGRSRQLRISALPSLASKWLSPRLHRFSEENPDLDLIVFAEDRLADLSHGEADVALRYGEGPYPGQTARRLLDERLIPVCAPSFAAARQLNRPADLLDVVLIHETWHDMPYADRLGWRAWFESAGVDDPRVHHLRGPHFSHSHLALEAALSGRGVALTSAPLAADDLREGRLIQPVDHALTNNLAYWAVVLPERADEPKLRRFLNWIAAESRPDRDANADRVT